VPEIAVYGLAVAAFAVAISLLLKTISEID
jgi:hypothetical protein